MLIIPVRIKPSKIHGLGIFTIFETPKNSLIWRYNEQIDYRLENIPEDLKEFANKYAYQPHNKQYYEFPGDAALFMNHSNSPNVICETNNHEIMIAAKTLQIDEELTANYYEFDINPFSGGNLHV